MSLIYSQTPWTILWGYFQTPKKHIFPLFQQFWIFIEILVMRWNTQQAYFKKFVNFQKLFVDFDSNCLADSFALIARFYASATPKNKRGKQGADAKSTTSYFSDLHFTVFQNRLDRGALICSKIRKKVENGICPIKKVDNDKSWLNFITVQPSWGSVER